MKTIKVVGAVIVKDQHVLIAQRKKGDFAGLWEFPGGKIEKGESPQEALIREILEEFEVDIKIGKFIMKAEFDYPSFHLDMDCFFCELLDRNIQLNDHLAIRWIPLSSDIHEISWVPADIQVIEMIQDIMKK